MIRSANWSIVGIAVMLAAAWAMLSASGTALADEPANPAEARLTFEEPRTNEGGISVSVRLTTADGEPITRQPVDIFVTPDFFGERPMPLQTALTNAQGRATVTYAPTWEGSHRLTARFGGDETYQPGEATAVMTVSGLPPIDVSETASLSAVRQWAAPGAVAVAIVVWLLLASILGRVGWGIWQAGRVEERLPVLPETAARRLGSRTYR